MEIESPSEDGASFCQRPLGGVCHTEPDIPNEEISEMFQKKFHYRKMPTAGHESWKLPPPGELFAEFYQLQELQRLRQELNNVKSKLNDYVIEDWSSHTRRRDPSGAIPWSLKNETKAEFVTVAWCKFFECVNSFPLVKGPQLNSLHLCEAPGAFIAALNHYMHSAYQKGQVKWNWLSTTLNPYYEGNPLNKMIVDDRFMLYTMERWLFHDDFTGNIIDCKNIEHMQQQCADRLSGGVHLITADGSIDCVEVPHIQEEFVATLHFAEVTAALSILADGGCFVLKMFTIFEATSVCKLFLLNCVFDEVHVFKPCTSKRGNSEVYVICIGYRKHTEHLAETLELMRSKLDANKGPAMPLFAKASLPRDFLMQHEICARLFMKLQMDAIESNIYSYELYSRQITRRIHLMRSLVCANFYQRYKVQPIAEELSVLYERSGKIDEGAKHFVYKGSYSERETLKASATREERIFHLYGELNDLERLLVVRYCRLLEEEATCSDKNAWLEMTVHRGKPYKTLKSSLFTSVHVMFMRQKFKIVLGIDPLWEGTPKCTLDNRHEIPQDMLDDGNLLAQQKYFVGVLDALLQHKPQQLVFSNFPFLTHLSVSLLRYLSWNILKHLTITTEHESFTITLHAGSKQACYTEQQIAALTELRDLLAEDRRVLCVVDLKHLHRNSFCRALRDHNNIFLLKNFMHVLRICTEKSIEVLP